MANTYKLLDETTLYQPPPPEYNPIRGRVIAVSRLASDRPVLLVELLNQHRIRAILNNDDIQSDTIPPIGAMVECIQESNLWVYVRTLNVQNGQSQVGVNGAGWGVTLNRAHVYATVDNWLGMGLRRVVLQVADGALHLDDSGVEISGAGSGIRIGNGIVFDGGLQHEDAGVIYQPVVVLPSWDWIITSEASSRSQTATAAQHSHGMDHTHDVDHSTHMKRAGQINIDASWLMHPGRSCRSLPCQAV